MHPTLPTPHADPVAAALAGDSGALSGAPIWRGSRFEALHVHELDAIYRARQQVFVLEQQCAYLDADGADSASFHLTAWASASASASASAWASAWSSPAPASAPQVLAYARIVPPGLKYAEASIGRVLTLAAVRGTGLGHELVRRAVAHTGHAFPGHAIRISAQAHLQAFYRAAGFVSVGAVYLEDGIAHIEMLRAA